MNDKDLESKIYNYFDNEVPEPNQKILDELKIKMHKRTATSTKRSSKKLRLALVSCIAVIVLIPTITLSIMWNNLFPSKPTEEVYYSDSDLTMTDLTLENLNSIFVGEFSKYSTLIEGYEINIARGYYDENNLLVYVNLDMTKNAIPFTEVKFNVVFVANYEHEYNAFFDEVIEFTQHENCKVYETIFDSAYVKEYYNYIEFEDYKVYLLLDKKDSSIVNTIIQN